MVILISDTVNFKKKSIIRNKVGYYIIIKEVCQKDITILNTYAPNNRTPKFMKQKLTGSKGETGQSTRSEILILLFQYT